MEGSDQVKILMIDDDETFLKLTELFLEDSGITVQTCSNPVKGLQMCKEQKIDIIVLDYFMPEMTGEEFVKMLRKFNNTALVILQTGESEKKPLMETMEKLDIQGYHDKTKGVDELKILLLAAIKTIKFMKINRAQEIKLNSLNYKSELIGNLTIGLINEAKDQLLAISGANQSIKASTDEYKEENEIIEKANSQINNVFSAIGFETSSEMTVEKLADTVRLLTASKQKEKLVGINISVEGGETVVKDNIDAIIFLTIETILHLLSQGNEKISLTISGGADIEVNFHDKIIVDNEFNKKVVLLLIGKKGLKYKLVENMPQIISTN